MPTRNSLGPQFPPAWHRPWFRYVDPVDGAESGNGEAEPKFPANTPVKDMTLEQQVAYWQHHSKKHENRVKSLGDWTPEKIQALIQERDTLKTQGQTDSDKEKEALREEGRNEVRAELNRERATHALERALAGRTADPAALLGLDVTKFVVNGQVDQTALTQWVEGNSTQATPQKKQVDIGQGNRGDGGGTGKSVSAGRDLFAERHKKSTS